MALGDHLGAAGIILGLIGLGITILWPSKRWIGWLCISLAVLVGIGWIVVWRRESAEREASRTPSDEAFPGISWQMYVRLSSLRGMSSRRYLFDVPGTGKSDFAVYLSGDNAFVVALTDANGQIYAASAKPGEVPLDELLYLGCEVGLGKDETFLKVFADSSQVIDYRLQAKVDVDFGTPPKLAGAILGADRNGKNGGYFDQYEQVLFPTTLTSSMRNQFVREYIARPPGKNTALRFQGNQWMRIGAAQH